MERWVAVVIHPADTDADGEGRTCVYAAVGDNVKNKVDNAFITLCGHENGRFTGKAASAAGKVNVHFDFVGIGNDGPLDVGNAGADICAGVVLVEGLDGVETERSLLSSFYDSLVDNVGENVKVGAEGACADIEVNYAGVLTCGALDLDGTLLVADHDVIKSYCAGLCFVVSHFLKTRHNVVGQADGRHTDKISHVLNELIFLVFGNHNHHSF